MPTESASPALSILRDGSQVALIVFMGILNWI